MIGKADAELFIREGATVVITDVDETLGHTTAQALGTRATFLRHDVRSEDAWRAVIATVLERFGRLDVLVNNAGVLTLGDIEQMKLEDWRKVQSVNVEGTILGCQFGIEAMRRSGGGSIINVSSSTAIQGHPYAAAYAVLFLASDESSDLNGQLLNLDRGTSCIPAG